ncbi:MAG: AmmeMemoRadiSam system protein B [Candidatus Acidiferrales bacterium]
MIRPPAVAGAFYPSDARELARQIDGFTNAATPAPAAASAKIAARGCVVPHAGYMYSGHVAGAVYAAIEIPARCILLGPRHFPRGEAMAILTEGSFATPLGEAEIDSTLARELAHECPRLREDAVAHEREHSLEVQIPFLQRLAGDFRFVPVVLATDRYPAIEELGHAVARVVAAQKEPVLVIASSDMNHYESDAITRAKDERAIARILALDPQGLYDTVRREHISMCGYAATVAMLVAVRELGASEARLVRYATSGDINGDREGVVGYAGIVIP